jgi:ribonuclease J
MEYKNFNLKQYKNELLFLPLGGSNEIGMNFNLYHKDGKWLIIDCGIGFADEDIPGIDITTPKIDFLIKNKPDICGMIITHIHEDHIGAVGYLWEYIKCPVWVSKIGKEFLINKLKERGVDIETVKIHEFEENINKEINIGPFTVEMIGITHSVPEMAAVKIRSEFGHIFHTGDWKLDKNPVVGNVSNTKRIKEIGKEGVYAMICDSTNVFSEGWSGSEGDLQKSLGKLIKDQPGRVLITTFASNIARLETIAAVAKKHGRNVVIAGFSLHRMVQIAQKCGYLQGYDFLEPREAKGFNKDKLLILCTGCQGETNAALTKIATGIHRDIELESDDTVIFSSKIIPGNDKRIYAVFNKLILKDIKIITEKGNSVHVSGHPNRGELKEMYGIVKPKFAVPVHGEQYHIFEHAEFAKSLGVKEAYRVKNGDVLAFRKDGIEKIAVVPHGKMCVDGLLLRDSESKVLKERIMLANSGFVYVTVVVNSGGNLVFSPLIDTTGFLDDFEDKEIYQDFETQVKQQVKHIIGTTDSVENQSDEDNSSDGGNNKKRRNREIESDCVVKIQRAVQHLARSLTSKEPYVRVNFKII